MAGTEPPTVGGASVTWVTVDSGFPLRLPTTRGMNIGGTAGAAANAYASIVARQSNAASAAFSGTGDSGSQLASTAAAYTLYQRPGLLTGLTRWDGSTTPGSQRGASAAPNTSASKTPSWSFDPFDQKTWDVKAPATKAADKPPPATPPAAAPKPGTKTGTGVVVALAKYSFNPFDQKSWDVAPPKGSSVDTTA